MGSESSGNLTERLSENQSEEIVLSSSPSSLIFLNEVDEELLIAPYNNLILENKRKIYESLIQNKTHGENNLLNYDFEVHKESNVYQTQSEGTIFYDALSHLNTNTTNSETFIFDHKCKCWSCCKSKNVKDSDDDENALQNISPKNPSNPTQISPNKSIAQIKYLELSSLPSTLPPPPEEIGGSSTAPTPKLLKNLAPDKLINLTPDVSRELYLRGYRRRRRIPDRPDKPLELWKILKSSIGKDISKIPLPVNFSEPLSMLQRLTEDYEYSSILDKAAECTDTGEQMCYVAAFTVSSYGNTVFRTLKPFNPLLGETYELDRSDELGWRCISEQVCHHPPTAALHCEGRKWTAWQDFTMISKFKGNSMEIYPQGMAQLRFNDGNHYSWRKVSTVIHNIMLGKLWVHQEGEMTICNHRTGETCTLAYTPSSFFGRVERTVKGSVLGTDGIYKWVVVGAWDEKITGAPLVNLPKKVSNDDYSKATNPAISRTFWEIRLPPIGCEKYYYFSEFTCQLNELELYVAPTDSRYRPDQRLMEEGLWDEANLEKVRLEEKQRTVRKKHEEEGKLHSPQWFREEFLGGNGAHFYVYNGEYWKHKERKNWSKCPDIF